MIYGNEKQIGKWSSFWLLLLFVFHLRATPLHSILTSFLSCCLRLIPRHDTYAQYNICFFELICVHFKIYCNYVTILFCENLYSDESSRMAFDKCTIQLVGISVKFNVMSNIITCEEYWKWICKRWAKISVPYSLTYFKQASLISTHCVTFRRSLSSLSSQMQICSYGLIRKLHLTNIVCLYSPCFNISHKNKYIQSSYFPIK